jgi:hypothetical protein
VLVSTSGELFGVHRKLIVEGVGAETAQTELSTTVW